MARAPGSRSAGDAVGAQLDQVAATLKDVRAGCHTRRQELDGIEAQLTTTNMSAGQAAALMEALQEARDLGQRLLMSLDVEDVRLSNLCRVADQ